MKRRPQYTSEFKERAVRLSMDDDTSVEQVAQELGISPSSLVRWRGSMGVGAERQSTSRPRSLRDENEQLQRQLKQAEKEKRALAMEVAILKKAAAFFARHQA